MPQFDSDQIAALANDRLEQRQFLWIDARDLETGDPDPVGFWNDVGNVTVGDKDYLGSTMQGGVEVVSATPYTIPSLNLTLNGISAAVATVVRGKAIAQAPMKFSWALFDPDTRQIIGSLIDGFVGWVDDCEIKTPAAGDQSTIVLTCESDMRALTIKSTDVRSNESQKLRLSTDGFFRHADAQRENRIYFGTTKPKAESGASTR
jgi:hypothetical protein